ncbi:MAG: di-trans,poly-cis-decaprenylcistransferase [Bacteroidales bacterium]|nr:di-trans,poly-cis-decaprenylcistransferase [Candidatus Hennigimonas equi]
METTENHIVPTHVSIIMDGNGRWAKLRNEERWVGHAEGVKRVSEVLTASAKAGVKYLSLYAFSEENWNRSEAEVNALMSLMMKSMLGEIDHMCAEGVRFVVLGNRARLSDDLNRTIDGCMARTAGNDVITLIVFLSYSGKWDILQAVQRIAAKAAADPEFADTVGMDTLSSHLVTAGYPDPDLIIRTSGESRISNYMLWQAAYAEFYFTDTLWPDFGEKELLEALDNFSKRDRRYGKTK